MNRHILKDALQTAIEHAIIGGMSANEVNEVIRELLPKQYALIHLKTSLRGQNVFEFPNARGMRYDADHKLIKVMQESGGVLCFRTDEVSDAVLGEFC